MSEAENARTALTRRGFLKASGVAAGALGAAGAAGMFTADGWLSAAGAQDEPTETVGYTYHQLHCAGHCSLKCTVRDGRLCKIEPNDAWPDDRLSTCCLKGISEVQHVYSVERIQTPLKRTGERGSGEFVSVSWDEALAEISERLQAIWDEHGKQAVVVAGTVEAMMRYPNLKNLLGAQGDGKTGIDVGYANGLSPMFGLAGTGMATSETRDWKNAKTLIMLGTNFLESSLVSSRYFFEAKEAGCEIIVVDPNYSTTASKASLWVPIEPGTDAALLLGMITCVLENGWYDEASMKAQTSFPYLVDAETGAMLRKHAPESAKETGADNPFMVWDPEASAVRPYGEVAEPSLEGTFEFEGRTVTTVFELLRANQEEYTLQWAAEKTGIPEDTVYELARRYALDGPATLSNGWGGGDKYANADIAGHAEGILAALTGNYGKPGASVGCHVAGALAVWSASLASWKLPSEFKAAKQEMAVYDMRSQENGVKAYIAVGDMFQQHYANMNVTTEWLKSLDFIVYIDAYHTTSADWADIVLPSCTKFESRERAEALRVAFGHVLLQGKVIDPLFESRTDREIEHDIAECLGLAEFLPSSSEELVRYQLDNATDPRFADVTLERLLENQGIVALPGVEELYDGFAASVKKTTSGRVDVYYENLLSAGQQLPAYEDPDEAYEGNELRETYPLQFSQVRTRFHIHSMFCDSSWIQQLCGQRVELNPRDMESRGLADGDMVEVFNDRGSFTCEVRSNEAVRPRTARTYEGMWTKYMDSGNIQNLTNDAMPERSSLLTSGSAIPFFDTLVEVKKA